MWRAQNKPPQTEEYDPFLHFAKRSRRVHREEENPALNQYDDSFWAKILKNPSEEAVGPAPFDANPLIMFSGSSPGLVFGHTVNGYRLEKLPSPGKLMGRKRKRKARDAAEKQAAAVTHHITELRKKQSFIDELKGEKWWGSSVWSSSELRFEGLEGGQADGETHTHTLQDEHTLLTQSPPQQQRVFSSCEQLLDSGPGGNSIMSFAVGGTAYREIQRKWEQPVLSPQEFWGFDYNIEE